MPLTIEIPDGFFEDDEVRKLQKLFGTTDEEQFNLAISRVVKAALREYRDMFLGQGLPARSNEIREFRLFYLIKEFYENSIPSELEVARLFQLPASRSKTLLLYVLTRFRYQLEPQILNTLQNVIQAAQVFNDGQEYRVIIDSGNIVDELDRIIAQEGAVYPRLDKVRNEANTYRIYPDSYNILRKNLGL